MNFLGDIYHNDIFYYNKMSSTRIMNYPKTIDGELYLCCDGIDYPVPDHVLNLFHHIPNITMVNIRAIKVILKYRSDEKSISLFNSIKHFEETDDVTFFASYDTLCYGNPLKEYIVITPLELSSMIDYPTICVGDTNVNNHSKLLAQMYTVLRCINNKEYFMSMLDILHRFDTAYYPRSLYSLQFFSYLLDETYETFFFFKDRLFYGNVVKYEEIIEINYDNYTIADLKTLSIMFRYVKLPRYQNIMYTIGKYCNVGYNEEQKEILKKYASEITMYNTQPDNCSYEDIIFFSTIRLVDSDNTLMECYERGFGNVDAIRTTIDLILSQ